MDYEPESQARYRCNLEWGRHGVRRAAKRGDALVIVDTLRFSTTTIIAVHNGVQIYPAFDEAEAEEIARRVDGIAGRKTGSPSDFSLSPSSFSAVEYGTVVVLPSLNGAACCRDVEGAPEVFVGALVNAQAAASTVSSALDANDFGVTVIACGEQRYEVSAGGELRFAIEDYLGAGAIISGLRASKSPEAQLCALAFLEARLQLQSLIWDSVSGWELRIKGLEDDVRHASRLDVYDTVPVKQGNTFGLI